MGGLAGVERRGGHQPGSERSSTDGLPNMCNRAGEDRSIEG